MVVSVFPFDFRNLKIGCKNVLQVKLEDKHQGACFFWWLFLGKVRMWNDAENPSRQLGTGIFFRGRREYRENFLWGSSCSILFVTRRWLLMLSFTPVQITVFAMKMYFKIFSQWFWIKTRLVSKNVIETYGQDYSYNFGILGHNWEFWFNTRENGRFKEVCVSPFNVSPNFYLGTWPVEINES